MVERGECENNSSLQKKQIVDVDCALRLMGYGFFHYEFLIVCACCILSAGFQNGLSAYLLPAAKCELGLSYADIGFTNAAFLVGGTISALFWGIIADLSGRKRVLIISLLLDFFANVLCCFVQNPLELALCRFLSGFIIGAPASLIFTYMAEFHAPETRAKVICFSGVFFTMSWLILPVIAWLVLSLPINVALTATLSFTPWRFFLLVMSLSDLVTAIWLLRLPESPDFLATNGRTKEALEVIKYIYVRNTGKNQDDLMIEEIRVPIKVDGGNNLKEDGKDRDDNKAVILFKKMFCQVKIVLEKPLVGKSVLMSTIFFGNMFGYFSLGLWLPEIFTRFRNYHLQEPNSSISLRDLMAFGKTQVENLESNPPSCSPTFDTVVFQNTLAIGICSFLGHLTSGFLAGRINRKIVPITTMFLAAITAAAIYFLSDSLQILIVACIFQTAVSTANMVLSSITVSVFPTSVNAVGSCLVTCAGRIGAIVSNVLFGYLMNNMCAVPIFSVVVILSLGGLMSFIIPEPFKKESN